MKSAVGKTNAGNVLAAILLAFLLLAPLSAGAQGQKAELYLFYDDQCPVCARARIFLDEMEGRYPGLTAKEFEVEIFSDTDNRNLLYNRDLLLVLAGAYGGKADGVPVIFIGNSMFVGLDASAQAGIEAEIRDCLQNGCAAPVSRIMSSGQQASAQGEGGTLSDAQWRAIILFAAFIASAFVVILALIFKLAGKRASE